jgi:hypothetical protein
MDNAAEIAKRLRELADAIEKSHYPRWPPLHEPLDDGMCDACRHNGICNCVRPGREPFTF